MYEDYILYLSLNKVFFYNVLWQTTKEWI